MSLEDVINRFKPKARVRLGRRSTYELTAMGKKRVDEDSGGGPNWQVLAYLEENSPCTQRNISEGTHLSEERTKEILKRLVNSEPPYIKKVSYE